MHLFPKYKLNKRKKNNISITDIYFQKHKFNFDVGFLNIYNKLDELYLDAYLSSSIMNYSLNIDRNNIEIKLNKKFLLIEVEYSMVNEQGDDFCEKIHDVMLIKLNKKGINKLKRFFNEYFRVVKKLNYYKEISKIKYK